MALHDNIRLTPYDYETDGARFIDAWTPEGDDPEPFGSLSPRTMPVSIRDLWATIKEHDPLIADHLLKCFDDVRREVERYVQFARDADEQWKARAESAVKLNSAVMDQVKEIESDRDRSLLPLRNRRHEHNEAVHLARLALANAKAEHRACSESTAPCEDATAASIGAELPPKTGLLLKTALLLSDSIGGCIIGVYFALCSGKVELEKLQSDGFQLLILLIMMLVGAISMVAMGYSVSYRFADARIAFMKGRCREGWFHLASGSLLIGVFTWVEINVLKLGLLSANFDSLAIGAVSPADLSVLSWVLGLLVSFSILTANATFGWTRLYGETMRRRVSEARAASLAAKTSSERVEESHAALLSAEELLSAMVARSNETLDILTETEGKFAAQISACRSNLQEVPKGRLPDAERRLRAQAVHVARRESFANAYLWSVIQILSSTKINSLTEWRPPEHARRRLTFLEQLAAKLRTQFSK